MDFKQLTTTFFQLLLPSQDACLVGFLFGLGNHSFFLIQDRKTSVGEDVIGIDGGDLFGNFDSFVETVEILQCAAQAVKSVSESRIGCERFSILVNGFVVAAFGDEVESGVVMVFGLGAIGHLENVKRWGRGPIKPMSVIRILRQLDSLTRMQSHNLRCVQEH